MKTLAVVAVLTLIAPIPTAIQQAVPAAAQPTTLDEPFRISLLGDDLSWSPCAVIGVSIDGCQLSVIRGSLTDGPAEVLVRLAPGTALPRIEHSASERGLVLEGTFVGLDGVATETTRGTYWYLPPRTVHGGLRCSVSGPCLVYESYDGAVDVVIVESEATEPPR